MSTRNPNNVIAFPLRGALTSSKQWGQRHFAKADLCPLLVKNFVSHLIRNNTQAVAGLLDEKPQLATVFGNYFTLPLLIAAKHGNLTMVNLLLENGACPLQAMRDEKYKHVTPKIRSYLKRVTRFGREILEKI